jgi:hypothetical protein
VLVRSWLDRAGLAGRVAWVNAGARIAHYTDGYRSFDGLAFPTRRRAYARHSDGTADQTLAAITVDIDDITVV